MNRAGGWDKESSPVHQGERQLHEHYGRAKRQDKMSRMVIRSFLPDQHREFYSQLPFLLIGSIDQTGAPWASVVFGMPGFVSSPNAISLDIATRIIPGDPLAYNLLPDAPVSFLGIEPSTRRRNRLNAIVSVVSDDGFSTRVVQTFGNCPQYIQTRNMAFTREPEKPISVNKETFTTLDSDMKELINRSDTFFVASHNPVDDKEDTGGVDVNHRGGMPGFIRVTDNTLKIPDYSGNFAFNTLGNFVLNPKAGLLFIDYDTGDLVQMTGKTKLLLDLTETEKSELSAERAWIFTLEHGHRLKMASPLRWAFGEYSPRNPKV